MAPFWWPKTEGIALAIKAVSHLKRNRFGMLYFRRVIPPDVRRYFAFKEISRSTGTSRIGEAGALARRLCATLDLLFERLREVAKNKKPHELRAGLIVKIGLEDGVLSSLFTKLEAGEEDITARLVPQVIQVAQTANRSSAGGSVSVPPVSEQRDNPPVGLGMFWLYKAGCTSASLCS